MIDLIGLVSAIGANINQRARQCNISQGKGRGQKYRSNNFKSENRSFNSSKTSHVGYDHIAKTPDLADKTSFKCGRKGYLLAACTSHETNSQVNNTQR